MDPWAQRHKQSPTQTNDAPPPAPAQHRSLPSHRFAQHDPPPPPAKPYHELPAALMLPAMSLETPPYTPIPAGAIRPPAHRPPVTFDLIQAGAEYYQGLQAPTVCSTGPGKVGWEPGYLDDFYQRRAAVRRAQQRSPPSSSSSASDTTSGSATDSDSQASEDEFDIDRPLDTPIHGLGQGSRANVTDWAVAPSKPGASLNRMISAENKGFQMLKKLGWAGQGAGIGKSRDSIVEPIRITPTKQPFRGIGHGQPAAVAHPWAGGTDRLGAQVEQYRQQQSHVYNHGGPQETAPPPTLCAQCGEQRSQCAHGLPTA
ncbi:hypothetical protein H4R34_001108 [Dimargaris verticillata]|uniref:G-patch domain-containing protein n=1 Tax=Dimargaris verticillata TaxID=2761393 RepID=A0A9W8B480_9FUNG|nr:hypothetical protein H4R34_001108 [Dimargaris verticillata]